MAKIALKKKDQVEEPAVEVTEAPDASFMEEKGTKLTKKISISRKSAEEKTAPEAEIAKETPKEEKKEAAKKTAPAGKEKPRSVKYKAAAEAAAIDKDLIYKVAEAVEMAQKGSYSKFPGTVEAHINTNVKNIRGLVSLPHAAGRKLTVLAFGKDAEDSGADMVGTEETIEEISKGKLGFDVLVTTAEWMPKLAKAAKILGPRGMMPNPKSGTITDDLKKAVTEIQSGKVEYRTEANGQVIHVSIGKVTQPVEEIVSNIKVLYNIIGKSRIKKITLAPTMGPGVKVELSSI